MHQLPEKRKEEGGLTPKNKTKSGGGEPSFPHCPITQCACSDEIIMARLRAGWASRQGPPPTMHDNTCEGSQTNDKQTLPVLQRRGSPQTKARIPHAHPVPTAPRPKDGGRHTTSCYINTTRGGTAVRSRSRACGWHKKTPPSFSPRLIGTGPLHNGPHQRGEPTRWQH